ncbi:MAG: hypothetical protein KBA26_00915 [Candidatus Delongbacteria bacterium]|nr:hypothetical protein [Candidatus Delongbacteria bacterium]
MPLKSARDLAFEKSNQYIDSSLIQKLSPSQKNQLDELRQKYQAKIAEQEIMAQSKMNQLPPDQVDACRQELAQIRQQIQHDLDVKIQNLMDQFKNE